MNHTRQMTSGSGPTTTPSEHVPKRGQTRQKQEARRRQRSGESSLATPCHHSITSLPSAGASSAISAYGILFVVSSPQSARSGGEELVISSLGFRVDPHKIKGVDDDVHYDAYARRGYYADPDRTNGGNGGLPSNSTWDYRGNTTYWEKIAEGVVGVDDLVVWPPAVEDAGAERIANYFPIPLDKFQPTSIRRDGVQSFYITLREVDGLLNLPVESWEDFLDEQNIMHCGATPVALANNDGEKTEVTGFTTFDVPMGCVRGDAVDDKPILRIGEGVVSYPFPAIPYFYQPRKFAGGIYYLNECPTEHPSAVPSLTPIPSWSLAPSYAPMASPTTRPSHSMMPSWPLSISQSAATSFYINAGRYGCHSIISTDRRYVEFEDETSASYGILFPVQSTAVDGDGVWITNLGFHVNFSAIPSSLDGDSVKTVQYELYALIEEGLYADPKRTSFGSVPKTFDYRGDFSQWKRISAGTIGKDDTVSNSEYSDDRDYFQIPWAEFEPTFVPPHAGIRSFYLTLDSGALVYSDLEPKNHLGGIQKDDDFKNNKDTTQHPPTLLYGEGVIGYPFHSSTFLYSPKQFIGRVFYERECPSEAPSLAPSLDPSARPSIHPSEAPSPAPSLDPSARPSPLPSEAPSSAPSLDPSARPSLPPSEGPSHKPSFEPSLSPSGQPSLLPSVRPSLLPSDSPSNRPSFEPSPSPSSSPSLLPSDMPSIAPSNPPTSMPSLSPSITGFPTHVHFPSAMPTQTLAPSEMPSWHPTFSMKPSKSLRPSFDPSLQPSPRPILPPLVSSSTCMPSPAFTPMLIGMSLALVVQL